MKTALTLSLLALTTLVNASPYFVEPQVSYIHPMTSKATYYGYNAKVKWTDGQALESTQGAPLETLNFMANTRSQASKRSKSASAPRSASRPSVYLSVTNSRECLLMPLTQYRCKKASLSWEKLESVTASLKQIAECTRLGFFFPKNSKALYRFEVGSPIAIRKSQLNLPTKQSTNPTK